MSLNSNLITSKLVKKVCDDKNGTINKIDESNHSSSDENSHYKFEFFSPTLVKKSEGNIEFQDLKNNLFLSPDLEIELQNQSLNDFHLESQGIQR